MSLRWKFSLIIGLVAAASALAASTVGYVATRSQLLGQVDDSISARADRLAMLQAAAQGVPIDHLNPGPRGDLGDPPPPDLHRGPPPGLQGSPAPGLPGGPSERRDRGDDGTENRLFVAQTIDAKGSARALDGVALPVNSADRSTARQASPPTTRTDRLSSGTEVRIATISVPGGGAVQVARSLDETNETLTDLRNRLLLLTLAVIAAAIAVGLLLARRATASLEALTRTAERVAESGHPDAAITVTGSDEIGRLGRSLQQMLASLLRSREQQQRLIQDAGHELRTPLTSLRTNIAVLGSFDRDRKSVV